MAALQNIPRRELAEKSSCESHYHFQVNFFFTEDQPYFVCFTFFSPIKYQQSGTVRWIRNKPQLSLISRLLSTQLNWKAEAEQQPRKKTKTENRKAHRKKQHCISMVMLLWHITTGLSTLQKPNIFFLYSILNLRKKQL